jgi:hypothetical protein
MRNGGVGRGISPTSYANYEADYFFILPMADGSGDDLSEANGAFNTGDYSGTTTNLWDNPALGVTFAGDGSYLITPTADLMAAINMNKVGRWVIGFDLAMLGADAVLVTQEWLLCIGTASTGAGKVGNGGGLIELAAFQAGGARANVKLIYRDGLAGGDVSATNPVPTQTTINGSSNIDFQGDGSIHGKAHIAVYAVNDGTNPLEIYIYVNGVVESSAQPTIDGSSRPHLKPTSGILIGDRIDTGTTPLGTEWIGSNAGSGMKMKNLVFWYSSTATEAHTLRLIADLYQNPGTPSRYL